MPKSSKFLGAIAAPIRFAASQGVDTASRDFAEAVVQLFYPEAEGNEREQVIRETMDIGKRKE